MARVPRYALAFAALLALVSASPARGEALLHASNTPRCVSSPLEATVRPDGSYSLYFWVDGHEAAVRRYSLATTIRAADGGTLADAWRFDAAGCQPDGFLYLWSTFVVDPVLWCPYLAELWTWGPATQTLTHDPVTNSLRVEMTTTYVSDMPARDPNRAYLVGKLEVSHQLSVDGPATSPGTCGGLERAVCIGIEGRWTGLDDVEHAWSVATPFATVNGPGAACGAVPVQATTWGAIKGQYR